MIIDSNTFSPNCLADTMLKCTNKVAVKKYLLKAQVEKSLLIFPVYYKIKILQKSDASSIKRFFNTEFLLLDIKTGIV